MLAALLALALLAPDCRKCKDTGWQPCPEHPRAECALEENVRYCSVFADCEVCHGVAFVDCADCDDPEALERLERKREQFDRSRTALETMDKAMGRPVRKAESAHFVLAWEMEKLKVDKRLLEPHELLHLYLERMEQLFADFTARLQANEKEWVKRSWIFVWWLPQDHQDGALRFCSQNAKGGVKLMGSDPRYSVCGNRSNFRGDEDLHRNLVHSVTHLLLSHQAPSQWIGNLKGGWADEGLAHWFEDRYWGICDNYCYQEQNSNVDFKGGKYRVAVRKMVAANDLPPVAEVFQQNVDTLTLPMHAVAFSYVDYLLFKDGAKFSQLVKKLKAKIPTRDALQDVFGMNPLEFETQWKAWVLETYPAR